MKTTTVPTIDGPRRTRIIAKRGVWAVTPRLSAPGRPGAIRGLAVLTHLPTGLCIQHHEMTQADARKLMRLMPLDLLAAAHVKRNTRRQHLANQQAAPMSDPRSLSARGVVEQFFAAKGWR